MELMIPTIIRTVIMTNVDLTVTTLKIQQLQRLIQQQHPLQPPQQIPLILAQMM
jgi:hypothetical protein